MFKAVGGRCFKDPTPNLDSVHSWRRAPQNLLLEDHVVHIWCASLRSRPPSMESLSRVLSADEVTRAKRFYFQKDRDQFIVARGLLRSILSRYVDMPPNQLQFRYGPNGKPALVCPGGKKIRFNLSHSNELAVFAVTDGREVGVDIEYVNANIPILQIAHQFFSPREIAMLHGVPAVKQPEAFYSIWTMKEAYVKYRGQGLALSLTQVDVSAALERSGPLQLSAYSLRKLAMPPGYAAAIAIEGYATRSNAFTIVTPTVVDIPRIVKHR
jgi:4'-phosphopantetheinyl transferase